MLLTLVLIVAAAATAEDESSEQKRTFDGLVPLEGAQAAMAYVDPDADFGVFRRVKILEPYVAFDSRWERDQRLARRNRIRPSDMERIRNDLAALFRTVFTERLEADDGYEVVDETGDDVLLLRPAIIDLVVSAPDTGVGRSRTFTTSSNAATLYIELFDSATGRIIGRAADRQVARSGATTITLSNRVTNTADAREMLGRWADRLRAFLESHYGG